MSFTSVELADSSTGVDVIAQRASGASLAVNGPISEGVFGVDSTGTAYFDTSFPAVGEGAAFGWDGSVGELFVDSRYVQDQHLMLLAGPGRWHEPVAPVALKAPRKVDLRTARRRKARARVDSLVQVDGQPARAKARSRDVIGSVAVEPLGLVVDGAQQARARARAR